MATIRRRGTTWNVQVRRKGYPDQSSSFDTKVEAESWARNIEHEMDLGKFIAVQTIKDTTVQDLFDRYVKEESPKKPSYNWEKTRALFLAETAKFMKKLVNEFGPKDLQVWRDERLKVVSPATVNRDMTFISTVFSMAMKEWNLPIRVNPVQATKRPPQPESRSERWSDADIEKVKVHFEYDPSTLGKPKRWVPHILLLAVETAVRRGEFFKAKIEDINLESRVLTLYKTKNGDDRRVPLSPKAVEILTLMVGDRKSGKLIPFSKAHFSSMVYFGLRKIELGHLHFHDARREATTRLSKKLPNVFELAAVTGHRELKSLAVYYKPSAEELAEKLK